VGNIDTELRALAGSAQGASFTILRGMRRVRVGFSTDNDDEVTGLSLAIPYDAVAHALTGGYRDATTTLTGPRPLRIELRSETRVDQMAKNEGVSVEWQSGDADFDRAVYVDSPVADAAILARVLDVEARGGVLALFALGFTEVEIDDAHGLVVARLPKRKFVVAGEETPGLGALIAFERVLSNLPAVEGTATRAEKRRLWRAANLFLTLIGGAGWLVNVGYAAGLGLLVRHLRGVEVEVTALMVIGPVLFGLVCGMLGGSAWRRLAERLARGSSSAHKQGARAVWVGFAGFSVVAFSVAFVLVAVRYGQPAR
jgi:hypothetical protein